MRIFGQIKPSNFASKKNYPIAIAIELFFGALFLPGKILNLFRGSPKGNSLDAPERILIVKLDHIGDVLLATPAIRAIKRKHKNARITCLVGSWAAPILKNNSDVEEIVTLDAPWYARKKPDAWRKTAKTISALRKQKFDACFIFRASPKDIAIGYLAGCRVRVGIGGLGGQCLLTRSAPFVARAPVLDQHERVLKTIDIELARNPRPVLGISSDSMNRVESLLAGLDDPGVRYVVGICPDGGARIRRWRPEAWRKVISHLLEDGAGIVLLGDAIAGKEVTPQLIEGFPEGKIIDLAGATSLDDLAAAISKLKLLVTIDTAARHFAAAFGVPCVTLQWCGVDASEWGSYAQEEIIIRESMECKNCNAIQCAYHPDVPCMTRITSADVIKAISKLRNT